MNYFPVFLVKSRQTDRQKAMHMSPPYNLHRWAQLASLQKITNYMLYLCYVSFEMSFNKVWAGIALRAVVFNALLLFHVKVICFPTLQNKKKRNRTNLIVLMLLTRMDGPLFLSAFHQDLWRTHAELMGLPWVFVNFRPKGPF